MTTITRADVPHRPDLVRRRVTGTPSEVAATVALIRDSGHLVATSAPRQMDPADPRVTVYVTVHPVRQTAVARPAVRRRWVRPVVIAGGITVTLAGLLVGGYLLLRQALHAVSTGSPAVIAVVLVVVALVLLLVGRAKSAGCSGIHCGGCGGH